MKVIPAVLVLAVAAAVATEETCPSEQETDWTIEKLLRHEDCNKFYKCTFGVPVEMKCYGGLYFNLETWQCDWPSNVDCEGRNVPEETTTPQSTTSTTTTTPAPTTTSTTTTTTPAPTTTSTTTTTTPAPTTTSTTTTTTPAPTTTSTTTTTTPAPTTTSTTTTTTPAPTTTTTTTTTTTPAPTTTSTTTTTTTPAPTTTSTTTTTTPAPTTTSTTTTTTPAPTTTSTTTTQAPLPPSTPDPANPDLNANGCPVDPHIHWLLPHETNCTQFYYCVWGEKVLRVCPAELHFNRVLQVCDWPNDAGCVTSFNKNLESRRVLLASL